MRLGPPQLMLPDIKITLIQIVSYFLAGLNPEFDYVRGRILSSTSLPSPREVYSEIRREETRRTVMLSETVTAPPDLSAMLSKNSYSALTGSKGRPSCDHCKKLGHTKDRCWELHGKPPDWKSRKGKSRVHHTTQDFVSSQSEVPTSLSKEQIGQLLDLLHSLKPQSSSAPNASLTVAPQGITPMSFNASLLPSQWIIDSGASDHMTSDSKMFVSYFPSAGNQKIRTAN